MGEALAELVRALRDDGRVPLAWAIGGDAMLSRAWDECDAPSDLLALLYQADAHHRAARAGAAIDEYRARHLREFRSEPMCWQRADAVRVAVPTPPTLADLLAAAEARRG